jgi:hypothetical protein
MKKSHIPKVKRPKLPSGWRLFRRALENYRRDWIRYSLILGLVTVPTAILSALPAASEDPYAKFAIAAASVLMNVALVWAVAARYATGKVPTLAEAYYDGSVLIVRYLLVSLALVAMFVPAAFGIVLMGISILAAAYMNISVGEQALMGVVAFVLSVPTLHLFTRFMLSLVTVARENLRPLAALRASRNLTLGYYWPMVGRLAQALVWLLLVSIPVSLLAAGLAMLQLPAVAVVVFHIGTTLLAIPIGNLYLFELHDALAERFRAPEPEPAKDEEPPATEDPSSKADDAVSEDAASATDDPDTVEEPEPSKLHTPPAPNRHIAYGAPRTIDLRTVRRYQPTFGERIEGPRG